MIDEPRKELELLEKQLLQDEEWFRRELDSAKRMIGQTPEQPAPAPRKTAPAAAVKTAPVRNYANGYGQTQPRIREPEEVPIPKRKGIKGLLILAGLETLGILGLAAYWVLVLLK